jgi:putative molybdopterin biosynthesis protein
VAGGLADAGIAIEAAARAFSLDFVPLAEDDYFLVCLDDALEMPAVQALRRALHDPAWQQAVGALPGYSLVHPGDVLSLTRALPWWTFRKRKRA